MARETSLQPQHRYRVTITDTGETKETWANTPEGAIKVAGWPPALCRVELVGEQLTTDVFTFPERQDRGDMSALTPQKIEALINWGAEVGIRPELGHACIMYGAPYPTVDGLVYHAKSIDPGMRYEIEHLSLAAKKELGIDKFTFAAVCRVYNGQGEKIAERIGTVTKEEMHEEARNKPGQKRYPIVAKKPLEMVENRAMWDALSDAYPLGIWAKAAPAGEYSEDP